MFASNYNKDNRNRSSPDSSARSESKIPSHFSVRQQQENVPPQLSRLALLTPRKEPRQEQQQLPVELSLPSFDHYEGAQSPSYRPRYVSVGGTTPQEQQKQANNGSRDDEIPFMPSFGMYDNNCTARDDELPVRLAPRLEGREYYY